MTVTQTPAGPRVFYSVLRNYHKISNIMDRILRLEGLTTGQYTALSFIKRFEPCTSAELARRQNITAQSMGEYLSALEAKGLIEKEYLNGNRRNIMVRRSELGKEVQDRCDIIVYEAEKAYLSAIPPEAAAEFTQHLIALYRSEQNQ